VFLCRQNTCEEVPITGPVLGVSDTTQYGELNYKLTTNDIIFFGSDGITEAGTIQPFGVNRLKKVIRDSAYLSAAEIADRVVKAVTDYVPNPHDDISMVVVKVIDETPETA
jgi:serine phosphatase RsbU (regulator of sigma subunit)